MSSTVSTEYSPTSNYSYPAEISLSPSTPAQQSRPYTDQGPPPRLSSPHIFRNIFSTEAAGPSARSPPRLPPLHEINFAETMQDVNEALQSANRAIQTANEAFQSTRTASSDNNRRRERDVVDLTHSPPAPTAEENTFESFLSRTLHPHDSRPNNRASGSSMNEPFYPGANSTANRQSLFVEEDDPTSRYAGQSDSLAGARRRYETQRHHRRPYMSIPNVERSLFRSSFADNTRHEEEEAIRRQRIARETWEQNQQRLQQRAREWFRQGQLHRQRGSSTAQTESQAEQVRSQAPNQTQSQGNSQNTTASNISGISHSQLSTTQPMSSSSSSSVEAVDLTTVNDNTDLAAALIHSQSMNQDTSQPRSALTAYKCPICLEPPRNATTTICGHLFCHECILETLKNSENMRREDAPPHRKVKGQCPVCRKELARKEEEGLTRTLVPLEIKLISKKKMEQIRLAERKRAREREKSDDQSQNKGKGKEKLDQNDVGDKEVFELTSEDGDAGDQKKVKRVKLSKSEELDEELFGTFLSHVDDD